MIKDTVRQISITFATAITLVGFVLSQIFPNNMTSMNEVSDKFSIYFLPARYTFLIWWVIFLGLIAYSVFQLLPSQKENATLRKIGWWYFSANLLSFTWMIFWHYHNYLFMMLTMVGVLFSLLSIYEKLNNEMVPISRGMRFFVQIPFSIYLGWVTMAVIADISQYLDAVGWNGFGISAKLWTVVLIVMTIIIAELTAFNRQDLVYLAVIIWSFIGIAVKQYGISPVFESACVAAVFVFIMAVITIVIKPKINRTD
jgi:translocator protein